MFTSVAHEPVVPMDSFQEINLADKIDEFRTKFEKEDRDQALKLIFRSFQSGKILKMNVVKYITNGTEDFRSDLVAFWQNIGIVAALIGAISVTVLISSPSRVDSLSDDSEVLSTFMGIQLTQAYYGLWALTAFSEICAVLLVTIANVHFSLMGKENDMIWFMLQWDFATQMFPQILLVIGCFAMVAGCMIGAFLVGDVLTGIIVCVIGGALVIIALYSWLYMLACNLSKETESVERVKNFFMEYCQQQLKETKQN